MGTGDTGTPDPNYNLVSVLYHALQGAQTVDRYVDDAEKAGDQDLAEFFRNVKQGYVRSSEQAKQLLVGRIEHSH